MFHSLFNSVDNYSVKPNTFLDVPYVPTDEAVLEAMLELGGVTSQDVLYDLGAGDGRIVITAARKRGARGIGIELDPLRVADAMECAGLAGVEYLVDFIEGDIFTANVKKASVVTLYLLPSINLRLRAHLLEQLKPGTRIVSHAFDMGDWAPDDWLKIDGIRIYKWIVPACVEGRWEWTSDEGVQISVELEQTYQEVTGRCWFGDREVILEGAELCGERLSLCFRDHEAGQSHDFQLIFGRNKLISVSELS